MITQEFKNEIVKELNSYFGDEKNFLKSIEKVDAGADNYSFKLNLSIDRPQSLFLRIYRVSGKSKRDFQNMSLLHENAVPIPQPYFCGYSSALGKEYLVMEFIEGSMVANSEEIRKDKLLDVMISFHSVDASLFGNESIQRVVNQHIKNRRQLIAGHNLSPFTALLDWLEKNQPGFGEPVLIHGDFHEFNILKTKNRLIAIDLSDLRIGDFREDLAYYITSLCSLDERSPIIEYYEEKSHRSAHDLDYFVVLSGFFNLLSAYSDKMNLGITQRPEGIRVFEMYRDYFLFLYSEIKRITRVVIPEFDNMQL